MFAANGINSVFLFYTEMNRRFSYNGENKSSETNFSKSCLRGGNFVEVSKKWVHSRGYRNM